MPSSHVMLITKFWEIVDNCVMRVNIIYYKGAIARCYIDKVSMHHEGMFQYILVYMVLIANNSCKYKLMIICGNDRTYIL